MAFRSTDASSSLFLSDVKYQSASNHVTYSKWSHLTNWRISHLTKTFSRKWSTRIGWTHLGRVLLSKKVQQQPTEKELVWTTFRVVFNFSIYPKMRQSPKHAFWRRHHVSPVSRLRFGRSSKQPIATWKKYSTALVSSVCDTNKYL